MFINIAPAFPFKERPGFKLVNGTYRNMNESHARGVIVSRLPPLLKLLKMPYTVDRVSLDLKIYDDIEDLTKKAGLAAGVFEADFDADTIFLKSSLSRGIVNFMFDPSRIVLLDSVLVHEMLHYQEGKMTPETYFYRAIETKKTYPLDYKFFIEFMVNEFRDSVVYSLTPRPYFNLFRLYKLGEMCISTSDNESKFLKMLKSDDVDFVNVKFAPIVGLPMLHNIYTGMPLMQPLFYNYGVYVARDCPDLLPHHSIASTMLENTLSSVKKRQTYDRNLTAYNLDKLYVMLSELPSLTFQMFLDGVKTAYESEIRPAMAKCRRNADPPSNKLGRNDPCPCGSGLKYKKCCWIKQFKPSPGSGASD